MGKKPSGPSSDTIPTLSSLLDTHTRAMQSVIRPIHEGPILYSDGTGRFVDLCALLPAPPRRYENHLSIDLNTYMSHAQAILMLRAFRASNPPELACLLAGVQFSAYEQLRLTYEDGERELEHQTRLWSIGWKFIKPFFDFCQIASTLGQSELINIVVAAATKPNVTTTRTRKSIEFPVSITDEHGKEHIEQRVKIETTETVKEEPPDVSAAQWLLSRRYPDKYATPSPLPNNVNVNVGIGQMSAPIDPLSIIQESIDRIGKNSALPSEAVDATYTDVDDESDE